MANKQLIIPGNRAFNSNGLPVAGAQLKLFTTGTTTPVNFYADTGLVTPLGTTLTANGAGRFTSAYQNEATPFRLQVLDAVGTVLDDIDPFYFGASTDAATAAAAASTSASAASTSATAAAGSATAAAASATTASTQATNAAASATTATTQAGLATTNGAAQVTLATTQATNAATSASAAAASQAAAATSETNASASAASVSNTSATPGTVWGIVDDFSNAAAAYMGTDGTMYPAALTPNTLGGTAFSEWQRQTFSQNPIQVPADIMHVILYGQSKSLGQLAGVGTYSTSVPGSALMFSANGVAGAGPRAQEGLGTQAQNHASLISFAEKVNGASGNGETGLGQFARAVDSLLTTENGLTASTAGFQFLFSAPGQSNTAIAGLAKGQVPYTNLIQDVTYGYSLAAAAGKTYNVPVVLWSQGERDIGLGTARATYSAALLQLYTDLNTDIKAITGQSNEIKIIMYQVDQYDQTNANIALAQTDAAASNSSIVITHPDYCIPHYSTTNTHYVEDGYAHTGSYYAWAFKRLILDQTTISPLKQSGSIQRTGNVLSVPFSVPVAPLILDNLFFPTQTNSGFTALDHLGVNNPITAISIAYNRLKITLTTADSGTLKYCAGTTWGGNLRDSETRDLGAFRRRQLSNCCLAFEKAFT